MKFTAEGPLAVPLWIDGHPYVTVGEGLLDVTDPVTGAALRRVPLGSSDEAARATMAAVAAAPEWDGRGPAERRSSLAALAAALAGLTSHFAGLVAAETGWEPEAAAAEVAAAVAALEHPPADGQTGVSVLIADATAPLRGLVQGAAAALAAGGTVVLKPSPRAPAAAYALCELSARVAWPPGVLNLVHGDEAAIEGLCAQAGVERVEFRGEAHLADRIAAIAARHGKILVRPVR
ncbi:MAG: aldehyde dehydrogenase family protein [Dechloromonas sp.]|nr:aldehyde dehydrogenase family protein [Dechloromonas sp.]